MCFTAIDTCNLNGELHSWYCLFGLVLFSHQPNSELRFTFVSTKYTIDCYFHYSLSKRHKNKEHKVHHFIFHVMQIKRDNIRDFAHRVLHVTKTSKSARWSQVFIQHQYSEAVEKSAVAWQEA